MKLFVVIAGLMMISNIVFPQVDSIPVRDEQAAKPAVEVAHRADLGFGFGLDYGGLVGIQVGFTVLKHLTFFGSGGYYLFQGGWNFGIKTLLVAKTSKHAGRPYMKVMYGCNSVIFVDGADQYNKVYKGFTLGLGMEFRFGKKKQTGFNLDFNVPLRTGDFWADFNTMKNDPGIDVVSEPIPIAFSIGFHHEF